jgi:hypothetical protein
VIYEMATGRKAFEGKSQASVISAIMSSEPPVLSTVQAMAPLPLDHVVKTCLAKDADARWQTAHDVLIELKWIAEGGVATQMADEAALRFRRRAGGLDRCRVLDCRFGGVCGDRLSAPDAAGTGGSIPGHAATWQGGG